MWPSRQRGATRPQLRAQQQEEDRAVHWSPAPGHHHIKRPHPSKAERCGGAVPPGAWPALHTGAARPLPCPAAVMKQGGKV